MIRVDMTIHLGHEVVTCSKDTVSNNIVVALCNFVRGRKRGELP